MFSACSEKRTKKPKLGAEQLFITSHVAAVVNITDTTGAGLLMSWVWKYLQDLPGQDLSRSQITGGTRCHSGTKFINCNINGINCNSVW